MLTMDSDTVNNCANEKNLRDVIKREKQEKVAEAALVSETLKALNVSIDALPQRCQLLLRKYASLQNELNLNHFMPIEITLLLSKTTSSLLDQEYEVLLLKQENLKLQKEIESNKKFLEGLRVELEESKRSLDSQNPNPENVQEHLRQLKQKLTSYEEIYEKAKAKFSKLQVPDAILPKSLLELASQLAALKEKEMTLKQRADDVTLARDALNKLKQCRG